jgi:hypothetical protein
VSDSASQVSPRPTADHNRIFERLVDDPDNGHQLVGFVAYVYYKFAKKEWVETFCEENDRRPNDTELRTYVKSWTDIQIAGVRSQATDALTQFASYVVEQERPKIVEAALKDRSFWREAFVACFGAFLWTTILIVFAVILKLSHIDLLAILANVGH